MISTVGQSVKEVKKSSFFQGMLRDFKAITKNVFGNLEVLTKAGDEDSVEVKMFKHVFVEHFEEMDELMHQDGADELRGIFEELSGCEWPSSVTDM